MISLRKVALNTKNVKMRKLTRFIVKFMEKVF